MSIMSADLYHSREINLFAGRRSFPGTLRRRYALDDSIQDRCEALFIHACLEGITLSQSLRVLRLDFSLRI
jgi:hypothetical protein